jgi:hypothetical protein
MNTHTPGGTDETPRIAEEQVTVDIRHLTTNQLAQLGLSQLAYVKPIIVNGAAAFAIHAADGTPMAVVGDRDVALAAIRQHEMIAAQVH